MKSFSLLLAFLFQFKCTIFNNLLLKVFPSIMEFSVKRAICLIILQTQLSTIYLSGVQCVSVEEDLTYSIQEIQALSKFRRRIQAILPKEYMKHDIYLIRWLRAKNLNIQLAEQMLKSNLRWRREQKIDGIHQEDWSDMKMDYPYTSNTADRYGRPIAAVPVGHWNIRRAAITGKMPRLQRYMTKITDELYLRVIEELYKGNNVTQVKVLFNMDGFNQITHACPLCLPAYTSFVRTYEDRYPGGIDQVIHINTPQSYDLVLNAVKPIFSPATQKTIRIFDSNKKTWMKYLDQEISRNQRSVEYGGTRRS